jgi:glycosyltransferase involved in cell wall biosynthesis
MIKQVCINSIVLIIDPRGLISVDNNDVIFRNKKYAQCLFENQSKKNIKLVSISGSSIKLGQKNVTNFFSIYNISKSTLNIIKFVFLSVLLIKKMKWKVELLVTGDPWESYWSAYFLNKFLNKKIPIQIQVHGDIANPLWRTINLRNRIRFLLAKLSLPKASSVRAVTKYQAENLVKVFGIKRKKIVVVPVPINVASKSVVLNSERPKTIGLIGRIHQDRGVWEFIKLVSILNLSDKDFKVIVIGDGPSKDKFLLKLESVIPKNRIIYLGQLPENELRKVWKRIGVLVSMAPVESYGRVMRESLIAGVPVWATSSAGVRDLMDNCKKGEVKILNLDKSDTSLDKDFRSLLKTKVSSDFSKKFIKENNTYAAKLANSWINIINKAR